MNFAVRLDPATANERLEFWKALDRAIDAEALMLSVRGVPSPPRDEVSLALESVIYSNIRLARAQLAKTAEADIRS